MNANYLNKAISACEQAFKHHNDNPETWQQACHQLGNILQGLGRFDEAIQWHSLALEPNPHCVKVYFYLGQLYANKEDWEGAIASLKHALKYQPDSAATYSHLAQIYGRIGQTEAEIDCWYQALTISPDLIDGASYHKLALALQAQGKLEVAETFYQRAIERSSGSFAPYYDLAQLWQQQGKGEQALACYQKILAIDPNQARAHHKLGTIYLKKNQYEAAIASLRQAIKLDPQFPWAYRELIKTFLKLEKWDEAIATSHAVINLVEEYPWVYVQLGNALRQKGDIAAAASAFQKACAHRGWQQCLEKDYYFTQDNFSYRISCWESCLQPLANQPEVKILEIGSNQGMSTCWLLDKILTHPTAELTCIAKQFDAQFIANLEKTGASKQVNRLTGNVHQLLTSLSPSSYDVINLQDKCKLTKRIQQNAVLAWQLLKPGGKILFNDYGWTNSTAPELNPKQGIDQFLDLAKGQWKILHQAPQANQLIVQRITNNG